MSPILRILILSYNVNIWRNVNQPLRQKIVAVDLSFLHVRNCSSPVPNLDFLRPESNRSAAMADPEISETEWGLEFL